MRSTIHRWPVVMATAVAIMSAIFCAKPETAGDSETSEAAPAAIQYELPECPKDWRSLDSTRTAVPLVPPAGFTIVKHITNVPEFHDCQKLLTDSGRKYGPLVAIFAAYDLDSLENRLVGLARPDSHAVPGASSGRGVAGALILNLGGSYAELGIARGFSCLYLRQQPGTVDIWEATIVPVGRRESQCAEPIGPESFTGAYEVHRDVAHGFTRDQYPAVARWDWDSTTATQYIGIACGQGWCEVGRKSFKHQQAYRPAPSGNSAPEQIMRIKGWYDEQRLAVVDAVTGQIRPGAVTGTVFPDASLGKMKREHYFKKWRTVAYVALSDTSAYYRKKLNLDATPRGAHLKTLNRLSYCWGSASDCKIPAPVPGTADGCTGATDGSPAQPWWAKIEGATNRRPPLYRCVRRMDHSGQVSHIPATARWRWLAADETIWKECITGCCQVQIPNGD